MRKVHWDDGQCAGCMSRKCVGTSFGFSSGTGGAVKIAQSQVVHNCNIHHTQSRSPSTKEKDHLAVKIAYRKLPRSPSEERIPIMSKIVAKIIFHMLNSMCAQQKGERRSSKLNMHRMAGTEMWCMNQLQ